MASLIRATPDGIMVDMQKLEDKMRSCEGEDTGALEPDVPLLSFIILDTGAGKHVSNRSSLASKDRLYRVDPMTFGLATGQKISLDLVAETMEVDGQKHECYITNEGANLASC